MDYLPLTRPELVAMIDRWGGVECRRWRPGCECRRCIDATRESMRLAAQPLGPTPRSASEKTDLVKFDDGCTGGMLCDCHDCVREREALVKRGPRRDPQQPWEARAA